jgi:TPR repeat protein
VNTLALGGCAMNSADAHHELYDSGHEDPLLWDQIHGIFSRPDQSQVDNQSHNEAASSEAGASDHEREHTDELTVEKQPPKKPVSSAASALAYNQHQRALRPDPVLTPIADVLKWPILERIGLACIVVLAVATVIVLLISYRESLRDSALSQPASPAWRSGTLPSIKYSEIESVAADYRLSTEVEERPRPPLSALITPNQATALNAEVTLGAAVKESLLAIPSASNTLPTANATIVVPPSAATSGSAVHSNSDEMFRLIKRGQDFLTAGDFASARLLFKRAADAGNAEAALALGSTYDPTVIKRLGAASIIPDIESALKWYGIAADRGSAAAADHFAILMQAR